MPDQPPPQTTRSDLGGYRCETSYGCKTASVSNPPVASGLQNEVIFTLALSRTSTVVPRQSQDLILGPNLRGTLGVICISARLLPHLFRQSVLSLTSNPNSIPRASKSLESHLWSAKCLHFDNALPLTAAWRLLSSRLRCGQAGDLPTRSATAYRCWAWDAIRVPGSSS